jgi:hypothetical protein
VLSIQELQAVLGPHVSKFGRVVWPIWPRYLLLPHADRLQFDLTAEATILNRYMVDNVKREFSGVPGVEFLEKFGFMLGLDTFQYGMPGLVVCRFKKLNEVGESRTYPTSRALALRSNNLDGLDGMPEESTIVDIGYVFNQLRTGFTEVQAIRVADTGFILSIPREEGGAIPMPLPLPGSNPPPRFNINRRTEGTGEGPDQ